MDISKAAAAYQQTGNMGGIKGKIDENITLSEDDNTDSSGGISFSDLVSEGLEKARSSGYETEATSVEALANKAELHDLVTAVSNAELTLKTVVALRDRMVSSYQDIIKMPI